MKITTFVLNFEFESRSLSGNFDKVRVLPTSRSDSRIKLGFGSTQVRVKSGSPRLILGLGHYRVGSFLVWATGRLKTHKSLRK